VIEIYNYTLQKFTSISYCTAIWLQYG